MDSDDTFWISMFINESFYPSRRPKVVGGGGAYSTVAYAGDTISPRQFALSGASLWVACMIPHGSEDQSNELEMECRRWQDSQKLKVEYHYFIDDLLFP